MTYFGVPAWKWFISAAVTLLCVFISLYMLWVTRPNPTDSFMSVRMPTHVSRDPAAAFVASIHIGSGLLASQHKDIMGSGDTRRPAAHTGDAREVVCQVVQGAHFTRETLCRYIVPSEAVVANTRVAVETGH